MELSSIPTVGRSAKARTVRSRLIYPLDTPARSMAAFIVHALMRDDLCKHATASADNSWSLKALKRDGIAFSVDCMPSPPRSLAPALKQQRPRNGVAFSIFNDVDTVRPPPLPRLSRHKGVLVNNNCADTDVPMGSTQCDSPQKLARPRALRGPRPPTPPRPSAKRHQTRLPISLLPGGRWEGGSLPPTRTRLSFGEVRSPPNEEEEDPELIAVLSKGNPHGPDAHAAVRPSAAGGRRCGSLLATKALWDEPTQIL